MKRKAWTTFIMVVAAIVAFTITACGGEPKATETLVESPEWIATLGEERQAEQLFVVAGVGKTTAYVSMHEKGEDGVWREIMTTPGYIGKNGLGKTKEGDGKTPIGEFHFTKAFGIADSPEANIDYQKVTEDDWWSGDNNYHYNEMVNINDYPELSQDDSEHIIDYTYQYKYAMNISYNEDGLPGLGSAIFLHCLGPYKPYTGGCVAIPETEMIKVLQHINPNCIVVIDSLQNLSPETWEDWGL